MKKILFMMMVIFCCASNVFFDVKQQEPITTKIKKQGGLLQTEQQVIDEQFSFDFCLFDSYINSKRNKASVSEFFSEIKEVYVEAFSEPTLREREGKTERAIKKMKERKRLSKACHWDLKYCSSPFGPDISDLGKHRPFYVHVIRDNQRNGKPVAFMLFFEWSRTHKNIMLFDKIAVHPSYRRRGFGRKLVFSIFEQLDCVTKIKLRIKIETLDNGEKIQNKEAVDFYKCLGFVESDDYCDYELDKSKIVGG